MGGQNAWISIRKRNPRGQGYLRVEHFSKLVGAQYGKPECLDFLSKTRSPRPRVSESATLFQASWSSVWEARMLGFPSENQVTEATGI